MKSLGKPAFDTNLIKIDIAQNQDSAKLHAYFGPEYSQVFGDEFMNAWGVKNPLIEILVVLSPRSGTFGNLLEEDIHGKTTIHEPSLGNARLSAFYFLPSPKGLEHQHRGLWDKVSREERFFFKGMAFSLLCHLVNHLIQRGTIPIDGHITLEASGGDDAKDMEKLVHFYRSIGFVPWTLDPQRLMKGYEEWVVPMMASVQELLEKCNEKSKFQFNSV